MEKTSGKTGGNGGNGMIRLDLETEDGKKQEIYLDDAGEKTGRMWVEHKKSRSRDLISFHNS